MGTDWSVVWSAVGACLAAATFAIVVRQETRAHLDRAVCSWAADYHPPERRGPHDDSIVSRLDIVLNGDAEVRNVQMFGVDCEVVNHRRGDAIAMLAPNQSVRVEVAIPRAKVDAAYLQLFYRIPPHRRGRQELAWLPVTADSPLIERVGEYWHLPLLQRLRWRWKHRALPAAVPGGPTPRSIPWSARRAMSKRARALRRS